MKSVPQGPVVGPIDAMLNVQGKLMSGSVNEMSKEHQHMSQKCSIEILGDS